MEKTILIFGALILAILVLFKLSNYAIYKGDLSIELAIGVMAIVFFFIGLFINKRLNNRKSQESIEIDEQKIEELQISSREYEVLCEIAKGASNKEIADTLFVSESTIKTHVSKLFLKLDAKRRTQAIKIAKDLNIIPEL
ncbi:response regulator transcription factor [Ulvibacter antarcticus]|uniref:Regulatory LuxR family protein n=1 Tax=Ulvibacter antarcticus TaxID=442714 RepID=A0A3L9Z450_9FLAO|nr:response regulator transcription factor [Ulvibacter antarcticus]RMA66209.1 regulatory LuxR family protein [Ulvibacter antarcticus]